MRGMTPLRAIKLRCLDCCAGDSKMVKVCPCDDCPLYLFRFGKNPNLSDRRKKKTKKETFENESNE